MISKQTIIKKNKNGYYVFGPKTVKRKSMEKHNQVSVVNNNIVIDIDEDIANLIHLLWKLNLKTVNSCQDNNGYIWVQFELASFQKFIDILLKFEPGIIEKLFLGHVNSDWQHELLIGDANEVLEQNKIYHPNPVSELTVSFRFLPKYYDVILKIIKKEYDQQFKSQV